MAVGVAAEAECMAVDPAGVAEKEMTAGGAGAEEGPFYCAPEIL